MIARWLIALHQTNFPLVLLLLVVLAFLCVRLAWSQITLKFPLKDRKENK